jgi:hypothetical protein
MKNWAQDHNIFNVYHLWREVGNWIAGLESELDGGKVWAEVSDGFFGMIGVF